MWLNRIHEIKPKHVFILLTIFWITWLYTELSEFGKREEFQEDVIGFVNKSEKFINKGERFTSEEGEQLKRNVCLIAGKVNLELEDCSTE